MPREDEGNERMNLAYEELERLADEKKIKPAEMLSRMNRTYARDKQPEQPGADAGLGAQATPLEQAAPSCSPIAWLPVAPK